LRGVFGVELRRSGSGYDLEAILSDCRIGLRAGGVGGRINQSRVFHTWEGARNVTLEAGGDSGSKLSEGISCSHALSLGCNFANFGRFSETPPLKINLPLVRWSIMASQRPSVTIYCIEEADFEVVVTLRLMPYHSIAHKCKVCITHNSLTR